MSACPIVGHIIHVFLILKNAKPPFHIVSFVSQAGTHAHVLLVFGTLLGSAEAH